MWFLHFLKVTRHLPGIISNELCSLQLPRSLHSLNCVGLAFLKTLSWLGFCKAHGLLNIQLSSDSFFSYLSFSNPSFSLCVLVTQYVWLFVTLWTVALQAALSLGFPRQEYWSGLPFPSPGDLPDLLHCRQILYCLNHREALLLLTTP